MCGGLGGAGGLCVDTRGTPAKREIAALRSNQHAHGAMVMDVGPEMQHILPERRRGAVGARRAPITFDTHSNPPSPALFRFYLSDYLCPTLGLGSLPRVTLTSACA